MGKEERQQIDMKSYLVDDLSVEQQNKRCLRLAVEILTLAKEDFYCDPRNLAESTSQQEAFKSNKYMWRAQARYFVKKSEAFEIWCSVLGLSPARTRRYILGMKRG